MFCICASVPSGICDFQYTASVINGLKKRVDGKKSNFIEGTRRSEGEMELQRAFMLER